MEDITKILRELQIFLQIGARSDLKAIALDTILSLTSQDENIEKILEDEQIPTLLVSLFRDKAHGIQGISSKILINLSAHPLGPRTLLNLPDNLNIPMQILSRNLIRECLSAILDSNSETSENCCKILGNLSSSQRNVERCRELLEESEIGLENIVQRFRSNAKSLEYLGCFIGNMTQDEKIRKQILDCSEILRDLLPFSGFQDSDIVRGGILGLLRNISFETEKNAYLLGEEVEILPYLLLPMAGNEEFDEEDNDKLPIELQYLPEEKMRESRPEFRKMILETLTQLCSEKPNREFIRDKNSYIILREYHKWERNEENLDICENLVNILIRTEEEIGCESLKNAEIPQEIVEKLQQL